MDKIERPCDIPDLGILADLTWADPDPSIGGYDDSPRGAARVFGAEALKSFCTNLGLELVVRAHQVVNEGYEFFCDQKLVTIFSVSSLGLFPHPFRFQAPNYCNQFDNAASILHIGKDLVSSLFPSFYFYFQTCSFTIMRPKKDSKSKGPVLPISLTPK